jgi:acetyltransferase-like isoleucine patch superfamily enzyme
VPFITTLTEQHVGAIVISGDDPNAVAPALKQAMAQGVKVVSYDADVAPDARNVFINQNCTMYDLGGIDIADDVMIGPNVSLITSGHPLEPAQRRTGVTAKPIVIESGVWIAAGATVIGGVTVGKNSVVAAGSVVTKDVAPNTLVGGNPARVIRSIGDQEVGRISEA